MKLRHVKLIRWVDQLDMGRWLAIASTGVVAISVWGLPPRTIAYGSDFDGEAVTLAKVQLRQARREAVLTNGDRVRAMWIAAVLNEAGSTPTDEVATWVPEATADEAASFRGLLNEAFQSMVPNGPKMRTGVLQVARNYGGHPAFDRLDPLWDRETYVGLDGDGPYCVVAHRRRGRTLTFENARAATRALGACSFYAAYGTPGEAVQQWLEEGGYHYLGAVFLDRPPVSGMTRARGRFGRQKDPSADVLLKQSCVSGLKEACETLFLEPIADAPLQRLISSRKAWPTAITFDEFGRARFRHSLLGWLRNEFGEDAFQAFWSSQKSVTAAFEDTFPVTLEAYMREWSVRTVGPVESPAPRAASVMGSLLFMLGGIVMSLFFARRGNGRAA